VGIAPRYASWFLSRQTIVLLIAAIIAFGGSLWGSFHFDDYSLFSTDLWRPFDIRPLTYLTFWMNAQLGGNNPFGYHVVNLLLHLIAVALVWDLLRRLLSEKIAWVAAAIFAVHPFQAEPVNYIFARSTLLETVLCLAAFAAWIRGRRWLAVAWFGAALLAKEECAAFPVFLLLFELAGSRQLRAAWAPVTAMIALALLAGIRVLQAARAMPGAGVGAEAGVTWSSYALAQGTVILRYLRMLAVPWGFSVDPEIRVPEVGLGALAWSAVVALAIAAIFWFRRSPAAFWLLGALLLLLPSSSVLPAADLAADRRLYLPMLGFACAAAVFLERARPAAIGALLVVLAGLSVARTATWRTEESLWRDAVAKAPAKVRPKIQLARALPPAEGLSLLAEAQRSAPDDARIPSEQGRIYLSLGQPDRALLAFGRALALSPRSAEAFNNRGAALLALDQKQAAHEDFERALRLDPCQFDARLNLRHLGNASSAPMGCRFSAEQAAALRGD
jgi:tetratricopeptide (TPR) repeat protein